MLLLALSGWPDAAEAATRSVRELTRLLPATRFASIDPEEFFDFTVHRPIVSNASDGNRKLSWVKNDFFYWRGEDHGIAADRDILILLGAEPHLRWRAYRDAVLDVAVENNVDMLLVVGALLAQVPHTRPAKVMGSASKMDLGPGLGRIKFPPPGYEGPSSMTSVLMEAMGQRGVPQVSLWGQCPHYLQVANNPAVSLALLKELQLFLPTTLDLSRIERETEQFASTIARALQSQTEIGAYVKRLEQEYDSESSAQKREGPVETGDVLRDLEEFLRQRRQQPNDDSGEKQP